LGEEFSDGDAAVQASGQREEARAFADAFAAAVGPRLAPILQPDNDRAHRPLVEVQLSRLSASVLKLTYDSRVSLAVGELLVKDRNQSVHLHVKMKNPAPPTDKPLVPPAPLHGHTAKKGNKGGNHGHTGRQARGEPVVSAQVGDTVCCELRGKEGRWEWW
jgi:hypothetical protein